MKPLEKFCNFRAIFEIFWRSSPSSARENIQNLGWFSRILGVWKRSPQKICANLGQFSRVFEGHPPREKDVQYLVNDNFYYTLTNDYVTKFIEQDRLNTRIYRPDKYDCDNYALSLMTRVLDHNYYIDIPYNFAFGMCVIHQHAINLFINDNYNTYCVEPQNDTIVKCNFDMCKFIIMWVIYFYKNI